MLKYSTFHHSSPTTAKQTSSPAHKLPSSGDPIWLPRQHSSDSHGSSQSSLSRTRGGGGHYAGLPGNCNNNNNNLGQVSHPNTPSPQHQPYCRVGVSPTCDSPGVREPLLPQPHGDTDSLGHSDGGTTTSGSYVMDHEGLGSKDSNLRSNGTLILWWPIKLKKLVPSPFKRVYNFYCHNLWIYHSAEYFASRMMSRRTQSAFKLSEPFLSYRDCRFHKSCLFESVVSVTLFILKSRTVNLLFLVKPNKRS